jgi:tetratricopeptide (TPR) repeat protein
MKALALGLAASCALNLAALRAHPPRPADAVGTRLRADSAVEDAALLGLGMRRLAADLGLVRLLVYYGTPEDPSVVREEPGSHPFTGMAHVEKSYGGGEYEELGPRAERVLDIDPGFTYVALYAAGALAFNLNRPGEALDVLGYALKRDPENLELKSYVAAIGFHQHGDAAEVLRLLEPTISQPDCPTMIKSMVAFLMLRTGRKSDAIKLYLRIIETSRDPGYVSTSRRMLDGIGAAHP